MSTPESRWPWLEPAVLAAAAAPLALVAYEAYRVAIGEVPAFLDQGDSPVGAYTRLAYFVQFAAPDRLLILPLVALAVAAHLLRHSARAPVRPAALALSALLAVEALGIAAAAGYLLVSADPAEGSGGISYGGQELESLLPVVLGGVLVLLLAVVLGRSLLPAAAEVPGTAPEEPGQELDDRIADEEEAAVAEPEQAQPWTGDNPERFRRPVWASEVARVPAADVEADPHASYRRPS